MKGHSLVREVLQDWERIVNRVAKMEVGEKAIVCGRSARWWDSEIKKRIALRRQLYKKVISGRDDLWDEYCQLRREVKDFGKRSLRFVYNKIVKKVNVDFSGSRKEVWAFVYREED